MPSTLLKSKPVAEKIYDDIKKTLESIRGKKQRVPTLATVLVGEDPASQVYVRKKGEMCQTLGLGHRDFKLSVNTKQGELNKLIRTLNDDSNIDGILVQRPLPKHLNETEVLDSISPQKDVDCFSPTNVGFLTQGRPSFLPCTPAGCMEMLRHYGISVSGKNALVVGRSDIVGKPMALLLLHAHATVTIAHSKTKDLGSLISQADIVIAAIGKPKFLGGDYSWKKDAVVIDVGINRTPEGKVIGDVDFDTVSPKVSAITPVPGGVGPMTIAMLMQNTLRAGGYKT